VREPTVFLMDEPLSHVDADVRHHARAEIKHMQITTGATVIYVTHDQVEAVALADRVVVMDLGVIQQIGTPLDLYYKPANLFVAGFIGEPPMNTMTCRVALEGGQLVLRRVTGDVTLCYETAGLSPAMLSALEPYQGREVVVGVRPQRVTIQDAAAAGLTSSWAKRVSASLTWTARCLSVSRRRSSRSSRATAFSWPWPSTTCTSSILQQPTALNRVTPLWQH